MGFSMTSRVGSVGFAGSRDAGFVFLFLDARGWSPEWEEIWSDRVGSASAGGRTALLRF